MQNGIMFNKAKKDSKIIYHMQKIYFTHTKKPLLLILKSIES